MTARLCSLAASMLLMLSLQGCFPVVAAGVGTGVMMAQDRRSNVSFIEDQKIEARISNLIDKEFKLVMHVNVTSFNLKVLLSGEVPDEYTRAEIGKLVSTIEKVRSVNNELVVSGNSTMVSRSNDSMITSSIKVRFLNDKNFKAEHVKVVTENGTAFLLGIVNRAEADAAAEIASTTSGVKSVVKLFEYQD
ncbi:MAG: BON domain-containing protein [Gallionella sp.]